MGHTACTEPQCLYKGALYLLPLWTSVLSHKVTNFHSIRSRQKCKNQGGTLPKHCRSNYQSRVLLLIPLNTFIFFVIIQAVVWILLFCIQNQVAHIHIDSDAKIICCWNFVSETFEKCPNLSTHFSEVKKKSNVVHIRFLYIPGRHIWGEEV